MSVHHRVIDEMPWQAGRRLPQRGFTLIELVMVIVLLGVLAVFAAPRIFNSNDFNARGFHDETLGFLRYAQKTAIAQRRTVCVTFSGTAGASLGVASAPATPTCDTALRGPRGDSPGAITAKGGVAYSGAPTSFNFDGLGQPVNAAGVLVATQTIQIANAASVIVEAGTGYVHD
ncbi:MAG: type II secretion system protein [Rhodoferax sp.]|uniref:pilus assembly FimT family protein n=1 Tax=Rhodoferax sp. TaxID=50421 RepID=UPI002719803F|nr:type II secretion system protein [Rhodoferax sp.]MDO8447629.1 type II secretion system protein [Rhodoferax sp.]